MDTQKMKRQELIQFLESAKKGDLPKGSEIYFKIDEQHYRGNLETPISSKEFENSFRTGIDTVFGFPDREEQSRLLKEFGLSDNEVAEQLSKNNPEHTVNEIIKLRDKFKTE